MKTHVRLTEGGHRWLYLGTIRGDAEAALRREFHVGRVETAHPVSKTVEVVGRKRRQPKK
jgi:hypothetical protein